MRMSGKSIQEINKEMEISKGTLSLWLRDIVLNKKAKERILLRQKIGNENASKILKEKRMAREFESYRKAREVLDKISHTTIYQDKLMCALIYYCEGSKSVKDGVSFINSDPELLRTFLFLLRRTFLLSESKIRLCMHLHSYHNESKQKSFWSKITGIPENQFTKSFMKKEGGLYEKKDYPGCLRVKYGDVNIARELLYIAHLYFKRN